MIKIEHLEFSYQDRKILKEINLFIEEKDFIGIIGPNGSGKSTLLKNISKVLTPDDGVIYLNDKILNKYSSKELAKFLAVVPQDTNIAFAFSVYDLIMMGRNPYQDRWGRIKDEDKNIVEESMQLTDTFKLRNKKLDELSGGERQRVIIARALAQKPNVLLLDEPTASLDINYQGEIFDLLSYLNKNLDLTIIIVSHDLNLTSQYCDILVLLNSGKIYKIGSPNEVLTLEIIKEVYNTNVLIKNNPLINRPYVTLIPKNHLYNNNINNKRGKIHIICGGGSAKNLMEDLYLKGYSLSCGVLNQGDNDWELARSLNINLVEIPPFSYIDEDSIEVNRNFMEEANLIIVADTPFGHGNISNLYTVAKIRDKHIILQNRRNIRERDYTNGQAEKYWKKIVENPYSHLIKDEKEIISLVNKLL